MYVMERLRRQESTAKWLVLSGSATVTGVGAGTNRRFSVRADGGGLGARVVLGRVRADVRRNPVGRVYYLSGCRMSHLIAPGAA
jgi:hypothetical protein